MERLQFEFDGGPISSSARDVVLAGVVSSGNLEVLLERKPLGGRCEVGINTSAKGFGQIWQAVLADFFARHPLADVSISINDAGATPAVVSLRLEQVAREFGC